MKPQIPKLKTILTVLLTGISALCNAQTYHRTFIFKKGDQFQRTAFLSSNTVLQRGDQKFNINSFSSTTKVYDVVDASGQGYNLSVTTKHIADTVNAMGKKLEYSSDKPVTDSSAIAKALSNIAGKVASVTINKNGLVTDVTDPALQFTNDTFTAFTGLQQEQIVKGTTLGLLADFVITQSLKPGYTWADSTTVNGQKTKNTFWVDKLTDKTTTVAFESAITGGYTNSNTNGVYVIDNQTGVILERVMKSIISGYQLHNQVVYAASKRTAFTESCYKIH
ncbi:hypothetical protein SAMN05192574_108226 [Mucilaginibacter gossypiicola]|uniref:Uncharacterized protein n=1 Tax=Mucilaginibacter gossypiicola TaxID=551995 RepID=A0A1H8Q0Q1_9SPHI|nr:DUF6263 family protein [Mucilaginibacter gossypiicola]SEO47799.1 hypothetical protein SAMN05192574_108226 [Mucilaginibacter gossypiicola]